MVTHPIIGMDRHSPTELGVRRYATLVEEAERLGYDITFINHNIGTMEMTYLEHCHYRNVDGVCLACVDFYSSEVADLVNSDIPCVTIDHMFNNRPNIISDNIVGIRKLVDRAVELGHRRIAYIHGNQTAVTENRMMGFYRACEALSLKRFWSLPKPLQFPR